MIVMLNSAKNKANIGDYRMTYHRRMCLSLYNSTSTRQTKNSFS